MPKPLDETKGELCNERNRILPSENTCQLVSLKQDNQCVPPKWCSIKGKALPLEHSCEKERTYTWIKSLRTYIQSNGIYSEIQQEIISQI